MKPTRETDARIAQEVLGHSVSRQENGTWIETTPEGARPLAAYSKDMNAAWALVEKLGITLIPIETGGWFAFVGPRRGWSTPEELVECIQKKAFVGTAAAVAESAPSAICQASLQILVNRAEAPLNRSPNNDLH